MGFDNCVIQFQLVCQRKVNMWVEIKVVLMLYCALTQGSDQNITNRTSPTKISCNDTVLSELDECWNKLPEVVYHGIPSDPKKIENACRVFVSGMECVDRWSQTCLSTEAQEILESSINGAMQVYKLLCTNSTFREEFLQHANCYAKTSKYLDACNNQFIMTLDRIDHANDVQSLCCVRLKYFQCVDEVARVLCSKNATTFLRKITTFLMQTTMEAYNQCQCTAVEYKKCSSIKSAAQPSVDIVLLPKIYEVKEILYFLPFCLASLFYWSLFMSTMIGLH